MLVSVTMMGVLGCAGESGTEVGQVEPGVAPLVVRVSEQLAPALRPILEGFTAEHGVSVEVRADAGPASRQGGLAERPGEAVRSTDEGYGGEAMDATVDVVISGDPAVVGALVAEGRARRLPPDVLGRVPPDFRPPGGDWVAPTARVRAVVFNRDKMGPGILPQRLAGLSAERFTGRFGLAPESPSFEFHMAAYRIVNGAEALERLLEDLAARRPELYADEAEVVEAVLQGTVWFGLVDHAGVWPVLAEDPSAPLRDFYMSGEDASTVLLPTAAAVTTDRREARELLRYLLAEERQRQLAAATFEYPAQRIGADAVQLVPLSRLEPAQVVLEEAAAVLPEVRAAIRAAGLSRLAGGTRSQ